MYKVKYADWILIIFMGMLVVLNLVVIPQIHKGPYESHHRNASYEACDSRC